jgi:hypothetical protein
MTFRVLITGSRDWSDRACIEEALAPYTVDLPVVLVSGNCPSGADRIAEEIWEGWGLAVERHPADWKRHGKAAGPIRNQEMVDLGADVCLAFRKNYSRGTTHCANAATMAGIETIWFTEGEDD